MNKVSRIHRKLQIVELEPRTAPAVLLVNANVVGGNDDGGTWANAFDDLQEALDAAKTNSDAEDEIWVAAGVYVPGTARSDSFELSDGVSLYGGFAGTEVNLAERDWRANVTILSGDLAGDDGPNFANRSDNARQVVRVEGQALLDGFTVTGGYAEGNGGGIYVGSKDSFTLSNAVITGNAAVQGGGLYSGPKSTVTVTDVVFSGNLGVHGGGIHNSSNSTVAITNAVFVNNSATEGGGIYNAPNSFVTVMNSTFTGNLAKRGGAIANDNSALVVVNSILWGDTATFEGDEIFNQHATSNISFSNIEGGGGSGAGWNPAFGVDSGSNIDGDPLFDDPLNPAGPDGIFATRDDGLRLLVDSPGLDVGTDNGAPPDDIVGLGRVAGRIDLGAYESHCVAIPLNQLPYLQDFSNGKPGFDDGWCYYSSSPAGRIKVVDGALILDSSEGYALNEAVLHLDLTGASNVQLAFKHWDNLDEYDPLPDPGQNWVGPHYNGDGVAISDDGGQTWQTVVSLKRDKSWKTYTIDLDQVVADAGMSYTSEFLIKFQQYDNKYWGIDGRAFDDVSLYVVPPPPADYNHEDDFSSGAPDGWTFYSSSGAGRIGVVDGALRLDSTGGYVLNEAVLHLDLAGQSNLQLQFSHRDAKDEADAMPVGTFIGHQIGDGLAISGDGGTTWYTVLSLGRETNWTAHTIDLDQAIANAGMSYTANFLIKFQQYDNQGWGVDGREFDNISVQTV